MSTSLRRACAIAAAAALISSAGPALAAGGISERMDQIAAELASGYKAKHPNAGKQTVAVFPFSSNDELAKQRVGFAVSELLTSKLAKLPEFIVVERSQLDQVLKEQKLQATGAIDPESAVKVGKLLGAQLLVLGSVEKLGGSYQVNARIVDAATSEVAATTYKELPAGMFEQAAEPYLMLVPRREAIGLYILYNYRHNRNGLPQSQQTAFSSFGPVTASPHSFDLGMLGGGVRYFPVRQVLIDFNAAVVTSETETTTYSSPSLSGRGFIASGGAVIRATANYDRAIASKVSLIAGAGLTAFRLTVDRDSNAYSSIVPAIRAGFEYRPQERVGLAAFANYDFVTKKELDAGTGEVANFALDGFSIEPTVAVYF